MFAKIKSIVLMFFCVSIITACGGGGGGGSPSGTQSPAPTNNTQSIIVDAGPATLSSPAINEVFTSVTICAPANPSLCQTIDHILVDTGSYGLRVLSSVLTPALASALQPSQIGGNTLAECTIFVDGYAWGPVKFTNLQIAGETANNLPTQIIGDPNFASIVPTACSNGSGPAENTVDSFGSNGVIGVGLFQQDCGSYCVSNAQNGNYFSCTSTSCTYTAASLAQQVPNPILMFSKDNNGVIISLPALSSSGGANSVSGTMTFGVGTQSDNALGSATVLQMTADQGTFDTLFSGQTLPGSYIDSGSNGLYFDNLTNIPTCADGFFCPNTQQNLSAIMVGSGANGAQRTVNFSIGNADATFNSNQNWTAYAYLGAPNLGAGNNYFDWGLPFFFGRTVYVVTENQSVSGQTGPFMAF